MKELNLVTEYQNGMRNARIYFHHTEVFDVIVYDADDDYTFLKKFSDIHTAINYATTWVNSYGHTI